MGTWRDHVHCWHKSRKPDEIKIPSGHIGQSCCKCASRRIIPLSEVVVVKHDAQ